MKHLKYKNKNLAEAFIIFYCFWVYYRTEMLIILSKYMPDSKYVLSLRNFWFLGGNQKNSFPEFFFSRHFFLISTCY
jgi:hypothetical protein